MQLALICSNIHSSVKKMDHDQTGAGAAHAPNNTIRVDIQRVVRVHTRRN